MMFNSNHIIDENSPLFIFGSSGHAQEIAKYAYEIFSKRKVFFVDRDNNGLNVITRKKYAAMMIKTKGESVIGSGKCDIRERMLSEMMDPFATLLYPTAVVLGNIQAGCVVAPGAILAPNSNVREHVLINYNSTVGHDTQIGALSVIGPGASVGGWCKLGEKVYVGAGALIREKITIGNEAIIGMGAVVTKDVPEGMVAIGIPARLKRREECGGEWIYGK